MNIEGCDNYLVFEDGVIINSKTGRILKSSFDGGGYYSLVLSKNGIKKSFKVHRFAPFFSLLVNSIKSSHFYV